MSMGPWLLILLLALPAAAAGSLEDGMSAFERGDYAQTLADWQPLADNGNRLAQYNLGLLYANGWGVPQDYRRAHFWYSKAAAQGQPDAQYNLGLLYMEAKGVYGSPADAARWWQAAADQGHAAAQFNLGILYAYGRGTRSDRDAALELWRRSAEQGYRPAIEALIRVYEAGEFGVAPDARHAAEWRARLENAD